MGQVWIRGSGQQLLYQPACSADVLSVLHGSPELCIVKRFAGSLQDQIRFSLHVQDGLVDIVEDYLETDKKDALSCCMATRIRAAMDMLVVLRGGGETLPGIHSGFQLSGAQPTCFTINLTTAAPECEQRLAT